MNQTLPDRRHSVKRTLLAAVLLLASASFAQPAGNDVVYRVNADGTATITLSAAAVAACAAQGGCGLVTRRWIEELLAASRGV